MKSNDAHQISSRLKHTIATNELTNAVNRKIEIKTYEEKLKLREKIFKLMNSKYKSEDCYLCQNKIRAKNMPQIIQKFLYKRHCSSLNYYYTKNINKILGKIRSRSLVQYREIEFDNNEEETLGRFFEIGEFKRKFEQLWKYHQFNIDQPRVFSRETMTFVENYFGDLRKLQEKAIRKMLDILSDSELERCELNLEAFMNDRVEIIEKKLLSKGFLKDLDLSSSWNRSSTRFERSDDFRAPKKININLSCIRDAGVRTGSFGLGLDFPQEGSFKKSGNLPCVESGFTVKYGECSEELNFQIGVNEELDWPSFVSSLPANTSQADFTKKIRNGIFETKPSTEVTPLTPRGAKVKTQTKVKMLRKERRVFAKKEKTTQKKQPNRRARGHYFHQSPERIAKTQLNSSKKRGGSSQTSYKKKQKKAHTRGEGSKKRQSRGFKGSSLSRDNQTKKSSKHRYGSVSKKGNSRIRTSLNQLKSPFKSNPKVYSTFSHKDRKRKNVSIRLKEPSLGKRLSGGGMMLMSDFKRSKVISSKPLNQTNGSVKKKRGGAGGHAGSSKTKRSEKWKLAEYEGSQQLSSMLKAKSRHFLPNQYNKTQRIGSNNEVACRTLKDFVKNKKGVSFRTKKLDKSKYGSTGTLLLLEKKRSNQRLPRRNPSRRKRSFSRQSSNKKHSNVYVSRVPRIRRYKSSNNLKESEKLMERHNMKSYRVSSSSCKRNNLSLQNNFQSFRKLFKIKNKQKVGTSSQLSAAKLIGVDQKLGENFFLSSDKRYKKMFDSMRKGLEIKFQGGSSAQIKESQPQMSAVKNHEKSKKKANHNNRNSKIRGTLNAKKSTAELYLSSKQSSLGNLHVYKTHQHHHSHIKPKKTNQSSQERSRGLFDSPGVRTGSLKQINKNYPKKSRVDTKNRNQKRKKHQSTPKKKDQPPSLYVGKNKAFISFPFCSSTEGIKVEEKSAIYQKIVNRNSSENELKFNSSQAPKKIRRCIKMKALGSVRGFSSKRCNAMLKRIKNSNSYFVVGKKKKSGLMNNKKVSRKARGSSNERDCLQRQQYLVQLRKFQKKQKKDGINLPKSKKIYEKMWKKLGG